MNRLILDGEKLHDRERLHDILAECLNFPEYYGRNLDALFDCLTEVSMDVEIEIRNKEALEAHLGKYGTSLLKVLDAASGENPHIYLKM